MGETRWVHVGTAWTNGQPFLALDATLLPAWRGYSAEHYDSLIGLGLEVTSVPVGAGSAGLVSTDGTVYDEGWLEFYRADGPKIAVVQAAGRGYPAALSAALAFPDDDDELGDIISVGSGRLVLLDACLDGDGEYSAPILQRLQGRRPPPVGDSAPISPRSVASESAFLQAGTDSRCAGSPKSLEAMCASPDGSCNCSRNVFSVLVDCIGATSSGGQRGPAVDFGWCVTGRFHGARTRSPPAGTAPEHDTRMWPKELTGRRIRAILEVRLAGFAQ